MNSTKCRRSAFFPQYLNVTLCYVEVRQSRLSWALLGPLRVRHWDSLGPTWDQTLGKLPSFPSELWVSFYNEEWMIYKYNQGDWGHWLDSLSKTGRFTIAPENGSMLVIWGIVATDDLCRAWFCFILGFDGWALKERDH